MENRKYTLEEIQNCIETLEALVENSEQLVCLSKQEKDFTGHLKKAD